MDLLNTTKSNSLRGALMPRAARRQASLRLLTTGQTSEDAQTKPGRSKAPGQLINATRDPYRIAFFGIWLFTLLLYLRPQDWIPALSAVPLAKIAAVATPIAYLIAKSNAGHRMEIWTLETKMIGIMVALAIIFIPISVSPKNSFDTLMDTFIKVVIILVLMINLVKTRERLYSIWKLVVLCGTALALDAVKRYAKGDLALGGKIAEGVTGRIEGGVGGMFENPNDLATALDMLIPIAVILALNSKGRARLIYAICAASMAAAVLITFSRAGFLGLSISGAVMLWKLSHGKRLKTIFLALVLCCGMLAVLPGGYGARLATIFNTSADETGSASERKELLQQVFEQALRHPVVGIGIGNFPIVSFNEHVSHNSYLETAAELGWIGFLAYMTAIIASLRGLKKIERETIKRESEREREIYNLSVGIQGAVVAYMVCSFFASIQYLWYVYYAFGYAIALRSIYGQEMALAGATLQDGMKNTWIGKTKVRGRLWPSKNFRAGGKAPVGVIPYLTDGKDML
jgi:O-antigen ligase